MLVVAGLILALTAAAGTAFWRPAEAVGMESSQGTLAALIESTRGRAVLTQQNARLVIACDPASPDRHLRLLQVVHQDPADSGNWLSSGGGEVRLPEGVRVVPPSASAVPGNASWPAARRSTALATTAQAMRIDGAAAGAFYWIQFTARGTTSAGMVLLSPCRIDAGPVLVLDNPDNLRGVVLRSSGGLTLINDSSPF